MISIRLFCLSTLLPPGFAICAQQEQRPGSSKKNEFNPLKNYFSQSKWTPIILLSTLYLTHPLYSQTKLIQNLRKGEKQVLVIYGTSLSSDAGGIAWVDSLTQYFNKKYNNNLTVFNSGKSAMWSTWGVQHLEDSVISKKPDAVIMEFGINDAFLDYNTTPELALLNLNYMIERVKIYNPKCEIILQVMNIPIGQHAKARPHLSDYYALYRKVAFQRKLLLIDHYQYWKFILDRGESEYLKYVPDGIHPDPSSARKLIAPKVIQKLEVTEVSNN